MVRRPGLGDSMNLMPVPLRLLARTVLGKALADHADQEAVARFPGHMLPLDVKKVGRIPDGGGWRVHGRGTARALASKRAQKQKVGYTYLHSAMDGFSRLAYTEALEDETAATTIAFFCRARRFFANHGITRLVRVVTDNGSNYRAKTFVATIRAFASRHQRTRPYTPRHNGKVERYHGVGLQDSKLLAESRHPCWYLVLCQKLHSQSSAPVAGSHVGSAASPVPRTNTSEVGATMSHSRGFSGGQGTSSPGAPSALSCSSMNGT